MSYIVKADIETAVKASTPVSQLKKLRLLYLHSYFSSEENVILT